VIILMAGSGTESGSGSREGSDEIRGEEISECEFDGAGVVGMVSTMAAVLLLEMIVVVVIVIVKKSVVVDEITTGERDGMWRDVDALDVCLYRRGGGLLAT
jgi:hypothetical protein